MFKKFEGNTPSQESENEEAKNEEIEKSILLLKHNGLSDSEIIQGLENPLSGKKGISKKEIDQAFQRLRDYGFIDKNGLITDEAINYLKGGGYLNKLPKNYIEE